MSQTGALNFTGIAPDRFARILGVVSAKLGATLAGNSGSASKMGVTVGWSYDGAGNLALTVVRGSFLDPSLETIEAGLNELIASTQ